MGKIATMVAATALGGAALAGCSAHFSVNSQPTVSKESLQDDIANRLTESGNKPESVTCKEDLVGEVGKTARCEVVMSPTNSFEPVVRVTGVDGTTVHYEMSPALSKQQVEQAVKRLVAKQESVTVDSVSCESGLEGRKGALTHCDVDAGGVQGGRIAEVSNVKGLLMSFSVMPVLSKSDVQDSLLDELEHKLGARPDSADCSGELAGKPGRSVDCTVKAGADTGDFRLTVTSVDGGTINYRYAPKT